MSEAPTPPPATIIGTGMITPIGLHTAATEAALRAGIARIEELEPAEGEELGRQGAKIPPEALGIEGEVQASEWAAVALAEACTQAEENVSTWSKVPPASPTRVAAAASYSQLFSRRNRTGDTKLYNVH